MLCDLGEAKLANHLPWQNASLPLEEYPDTERALQAFSIFFQLLNMAEENSAAQNRRALEAEAGLSNLTGLWGRTLLRFREQEIPETTICSLLPEVSVVAVLTAHPTEAKRKTVLEQHRQLYLLLVQRENQMWTPLEQLDIRNKIKVVMERLWRTGEILYEKPDISDERRNVIHYLYNIFSEVLPMLDRRLLLRSASMSTNLSPPVVKGLTPSTCNRSSCSPNGGNCTFPGKMRRGRNCCWSSL